MRSDWAALLKSLHKRDRAHQLNWFQDPSIAAYVARLPIPERIPLLLDAYRRYRELGPPPEEFCSEHFFASSAHSLLISRLLASPLHATGDDVCAILIHSHHFCGHGGDVRAPLRLAEEAFANRPYSIPLFDAARVYRQTLQGLTSVQAQLAKQELGWILWHDSRHPEKRCFTRRLQLSLRDMAPEEALAWQWMLRHTTHALNHARGKVWLREAELRLAPLGSKRYCRRLREWFVFDQQESVRLEPPGSNVLRLLVSYAVLAPAALPVVARLKQVNWASPATARKVLTGLAWVEARP